MIKRCYEVLMALDPPITSGEADVLTAKLKQLVTEGQGEIKVVERLGLRRLAFRVHGRTEAQFMLLSCEMPTDVVKKIEGVLELHEHVLRYMTTRISPVMLAQTISSQQSPAPAHAAPSVPAGAGTSAPAVAGAPAA